MVVSWLGKGTYGQILAETVFRFQGRDPSWPIGLDALPEKGELMLNKDAENFGPRRGTTRAIMQRMQED